MNTQRYERRKFIVDTEFQYRLIRKISFMQVLVIIMSLGFLALVYYLYGDIRVHVIQPDPFAQLKGIQTLEEPQTLLRLLWPLLAVCLLVTLVATFLYSIIISHRMAGPIYRFKQVLGEMGEGDLRGDVRLREKDDFKSLAESINMLKKNLRARFNEIQGLCRDLALSEDTGTKEEVKRLEEILSEFRCKEETEGGR